MLIISWLPHQEEVSAMYTSFSLFVVIDRINPEDFMKDGLKLLALPK